MYTSTYSSSPVRTSTSETQSTNYQTQAYHSSNNINTMNDNNMTPRRGTGGYSNSASSLTSIPLRSPISSRNYSNNYNDSPNQQNRYQSTSYRSYGNDNDTYRANNTRAYSYEDLTNEQYRSQPSIYNSRGYQQQPQPQPKRSDQYNEYDDDLIVKSTDLPANYEQEMIHLVKTAFRKYEISNQRELAGFLKRAADKTFAPCWHCIVGRQFSSYVTHEMNGFIYFTKGSLSILLFKSGA